MKDKKILDFLYHSGYVTQPSKHSYILILALLKILFLQTDHNDLSLEVRSCCQNKGVTMSDVDRHVRVLMADMMGMNLGNEENSEDDGTKVVLSASQMGEWLKSYFVAKEELETRIGAVVAGLQLQSSIG